MPRLKFPQGQLTFPVNGWCSSLPRKDRWCGQLRRRHTDAGKLLLVIGMKKNPVGIKIIHRPVVRTLCSTSFSASEIDSIFKTYLTYGVAYGSAGADQGGEPFDGEGCDARLKMF